MSSKYVGVGEEKARGHQPARRAAAPVRLEFVVRPPLGAGPRPGSGRPNGHCSARHGPPMWPPAKVNSVWSFNDAWLRTSWSEARRQAPRNGASSLDAARVLGIRDAQPQGQGGLDGEIRVSPLPTPPAAPAGRPGSDRFRGQPHRHIAASNEGLIVGWPVRNAVLRLVPGMDLPLHPCSVAPAEGHEKRGPSRPTGRGSSCNNAVLRSERTDASVIVIQPRSLRNLSSDAATASGLKDSGWRRTTASNAMSSIPISTSTL